MRLVNCQAAANVAAATASKCCKCLQLLQLPGKPATAMPQLPSLSTLSLSFFLFLPLSLPLPRPFTALFCVLAKTTENLATCFEPHRTSSSAGGQQCHTGQGQCQRGQVEGQGGHSCLVVASGILGGCYAGRPAFKGVCNTHELAKAALPCAKSLPPPFTRCPLSVSPGARPARHIANL